MRLLNSLKSAALAVLLLVGFVQPTLADDAQQALSKESVIEGIKERGVLKVGVSFFVPWVMRDKKGELVGFEVDVARKLAADMSVDVEFIPTAWDGIIPALVAGKFDVIIGGMTITPARNLTVNFSNPYNYTGMTLYANKEMTKGFTLEDFNSPDVIFSARRGATPVAAIQDAFPKAQLLQFDEDGAAVQEVLNGRAHASMSSEPTPTREISKHPDILYKPLNELFRKGGAGIVVRKGDPDALNFFNNWVLINWNNGYLESRNEYWFKSLAWEKDLPE
ncbi:MAG: transporter substrate-binding domain-containing protein [Alphaproteobacteria bacterium]|nr:transporter substrate-binding domain-containing protein [Alphaproteobacteria bacterium]